MRYCKAYTLKELRTFPDWDAHATQASKDLPDDKVVFVLENLAVTINALEMDKEEDFIFTEITESWEKFCKSTLEFAVPDWEKESEAVREALAKAESPS